MAGSYLRRELPQRISLETLPMKRDPLPSLCHSIGFQTSPSKQTARRDWRKADHSRLEGGILNMQGDLHTRLVLDAARLDRSTHPPESQRLSRSYNCVQSCPSRWSQQHIILSSLCSWEQLPLWELWTEVIFQGQVRVWAASDCLSLACRSTSAQVLSVTSSNTPPPGTGPYNLTRPCSAMCCEWSARDFINMEDAHVAAIWLHVYEGRHHSGGTRKRKHRLR